PRMVLRGHTQPITGVAVTKGPRPMIVSGSEDHSLRIWDSATTGLSAGRELWSVVLRSAVRSVACTPPGATANLALAGTNDGSVYLLNLDNLRGRKEDSVRLFPETHQSAVNCVAFSPDG